MTEADAATALSTQARTGELDRRCVDAVLTSVGQLGPRTRRAASIALTERETDVLRLVAREQTNPAIAATLGISPKTVERHVTHIYQKIGVSSRAGAAIHALENGLLQQSQAAARASPTGEIQECHEGVTRPCGPTAPMVAVLRERLRQGMP